MPSHFQADVDSSAAVALPGTEHMGYIIINLGPDTVYLGGDDTVDDDSGFPVAANGAFSPGEIAHRSLAARPQDRLYAICASTETADLRIIVPSRTSP